MVDTIAWACGTVGVRLMWDLFRSVLSGRNAVAGDSMVLPCRYDGVVVARAHHPEFIQSRRTSRKRAQAREYVCSPISVQVAPRHSTLAPNTIARTILHVCPTARPRQSRQQPGASPEPIEIEDLRALVVPVRASASSAPEMSPEGGPAPYPSMGEVSSAMWCEYDDDSDGDIGEDGRDEGRGTASTGRGANKHRSRRRHQPHRLLRVSVQTLDGHVCDDEDEDSETDDGESETDNEGESDGDERDERDERAAPSRPLRWGRRGRGNDPPRGTSGVSRVSRGKGPGDGKKGRRAFGARANKKKEEEFDEVDCQRKEELASVLRRLRVAIRRMDGVLTEEKVWFGPQGRKAHQKVALHSGRFSSAAALWGSEL